MASFIPRSPRKPTTFRAVFDDGEVFIAGPVRDMSTSGLFIETTSRIELGKRMKVVPIANDASAGVLEIDAEVARVVESGARTRPGFAVRFLNLLPEEREQVRALALSDTRPFRTTTARGSTASARAQVKKTSATDEALPILLLTRDEVSSVRVSPPPAAGGAHDKTPSTPIQAQPAMPATTSLGALAQAWVSGPSKTASSPANPARPQAVTFARPQPSLPSVAVSGAGRTTGKTTTTGAATLAGSHAISPKQSTRPGMVLIDKAEVDGLKKAVGEAEERLEELEERSSNIIVENARLVADAEARKNELEELRYRASLAGLLETELAEVRQDLADTELLRQRLSDELTRAEQRIKEAELVAAMPRGPSGSDSDELEKALTSLGEARMKCLVLEGKVSQLEEQLRGARTPNGTRVMTQTPDEPIVMPRMPPPAPATVNLDLEGLADEDLAAVRAPFRLERPLLVANTLLLAGLVTASSFGLARLDQHDDGPSFAAPRHGDAKQEGASEPGLPSEPGAPVKAVAAPAPVAPPAPAAAAAEPEPSSRTTTVHDVKTTLRVRAERRDRKTATLIVSLDEKNEGKITADVVFHRARVFVAKLAGPLDRVHDPTEHGPVPWERLTTETHVSSKAALAAFADTPGYEADAFGSADVGGAGTGALVGGASSTSELRFTLKTKGRDVAAVVSEIGLRLPDGRVERRVRSRVIPLR